MTVGHARVKGTVAVTNRLIHGEPASRGKKIAQRDAWERPDGRGRRKKKIPSEVEFMKKSYHNDPL